MYNCSYENLYKFFNNNMKIKLISEKFEVCDINNSLDSIRQILLKKNYDVIGIEEDNNIVGFISKKKIKDRNANNCRNYIQNFTSENLISENTSISETLYLFKNRSWIFLLNGNNEIQIVTRADLQKMPVRISLFGMISLLEMNLNRRIKDKFEDNWKECLDNKRIEKAKDIYYDRKSKNYEISLIDCLELCDKLQIIRKKDNEILEKLKLSKIKFKKLIGHILIVRNNLAHSQDITYKKSLGKMIDVFENLDELNKIFVSTNSN